jgi:hypothetical protein
MSNCDIITLRLENATRKGGLITRLGNSFQVMISPNEVNMQNQFIEKPASKKSIAFRKPVHGVGINDADYEIHPTINGKKAMCKYYRSWHSMLERCYSKKVQARQPAYKGCTVCDEWLTFSNFKSWMIKQEWQGKALDKDIRVKGNKVYSPETCMFVTAKENTVEALAKTYIFKSPSGEVVKIYNMAEFCRNNGLNQGTMSSVHSGRRSQHKGWASSRLMT